MHNFSKTFKKVLSPVIFCLLLAISALLSLDKKYSSAVLSGISLWVANVLPALFPYFFITALLSAMEITSKLSLKLTPLTKRLFNVGGLSGYAFLMSVISGYPIGAKIVSDLKEKGLISKTESERASALCSSPSPMFLIGSVGNIAFGNFKFGAFLFLACLISIILVGIIFSFYKRKDKPSEYAVLPTTATDNLLYESAYSSVISVLVVGGLITLFYLLTEILSELRILYPLNALFGWIFGDYGFGEGITLGLFECTKGVKKIAESGIGFWTLPVVCGICGFGGLSVVAQSLAYLKKAKIKTAVFLLGKGLTAVTCFIIGLIFSLFL